MSDSDRDDRVRCAAGGSPAGAAGGDQARRGEGVEGDPVPPARRLRISMVGIAHPMRGGIAQYTAILARELARRHEVSLVSFTRQYPSLLFPGKSQIDTSESPMRFPADPVVDSIGPLSWLRAGRRIAEFAPDGIVYKYWMPFFAPAFGTILRRARKLCRKRPFRSVMVVDNLIPHERRPMDMQLTRYVMNATDAYIVQSGAVREDLLRLDPGARFLEVPHPVYNLFGERIPKPEARRRLGLDPEAPVLLFFGFIRAYKGLDILIRAMQKIRKGMQGPIAPRLLVLGEFYEGRAETAALVRDLGLEDAVTILDQYVPDEEVGPYFSAADVVVLPYRSATQSGIVQIAYQFERPVICTDVGGLSEVVLDGRTGFVIPPESPDLLADAVLRYYRGNLEADFEAAIREEKTKYSWDRLVEAVETLVREPSGQQGTEGAGHR